MLPIALTGIFGNITLPRFFGQLKDLMFAVESEVEKIKNKNVCQWGLNRSICVRCASPFITRTITGRKHHQEASRI